MQEQIQTPQFSRTDALRETKTELHMRRKVWKTIGKPSEARFSDLGHQKRYNILEFAIDILDEMTDKEWHSIWSRIQSKKKQADSVQTMF